MAISSREQFTNNAVTSPIEPPLQEHHLFPQWRGTELSLFSIGGSTLLNSGLGLLNSFKTQGLGMFSRAALGETGALVARGFGGATVVTGSAFDAFTVAGGAVTGDKTLVGRGLAGLGGSAAGLGIVLAGAAALSLPITGPAAGIAIGCGFMAGGLAGNLMRDYSSTVRHRTDDVMGQGLINLTPDAIKRPGARIYNNVIAEAENIIHDPLGEARRAVDAVGDWFGGHPVTHAPEAHRRAPSQTPQHTPPRAPAPQTAPRDRHAAAH